MKNIQNIQVILMTLLCFGCITCEAVTYYNQNNNCCEDLGSNEKLNSACNFWASTGLCPSPYFIDPSITSKCPCTNKYSSNMVSLPSRLTSSYNTYSTTPFKTSTSNPIFDYEKALETNPQNVFAWKMKGDDLNNKNNNKEALEAYERALEINPNDSSLWSSKGWVLFKLWRYSDAVDAYKKSLLIDPTLADVWTKMGYALFKLGKYEDAIAAYDKAIKIDPSVSDPYNNKKIAQDNIPTSSTTSQSTNIDIEKNFFLTTDTKSSSTKNSIDLTITDFIARTTNSGKEVSFDLMIKNCGSGKAGKFNIAYFLSDEQTETPFMQVSKKEYKIGYDDVTGLEGNESLSGKSTKTVTITSEIPKGIYWFGIYVDSGNTIVESDEKNNIKYWKDQISI